MILKEYNNFSKKRMGNECSNICDRGDEPKRLRAENTNPKE
jgi:hypothetical protein